MKKEKSTYSLDSIVDTVCKDDKEADFIRRILAETLSIYQWHYQTASDKPQRDVENSAVIAVKKTIKLLQDIGQNTLAEEVESVLVDNSILRKGTILSNAKNHMKDKILIRDKLEKKLLEIETAYDKGKISKDAFKEKKQKIEKYFNIYPNYGITASTYKNNYAMMLSEAFIEWCKKYPLKKAPDHLDFDFDPLS